MTSAVRALPGEPVMDGVSRIPGFVNSYVVTGDDGTYLIDTGFSRKARAIARAFRHAGVPLGSVRTILLTHHHVDHMGGASFLRQQTSAPVACHADDIPYVDGRTKASMPRLMRLFVRVHPTPVGTPLRDGDRLGPLVVVHTPGHTPGEVVFFEPTRKLVFSGDAVVEREGHLALPASRFAANLEQAVGSLDRIQALGAEALLPGHGRPVTKDVAFLLDDLIRRAPATYLHPRAA